MAWGSIWDMGAITVVGGGVAVVIVRHLWRMFRPSGGSACGGGCRCGTKRTGEGPPCP